MDTDQQSASKKLWRPFEEIISWLKTYEMGRDIDGKSKTSKFGVGLGLAIVKQIADFTHISITYSYHGKHLFTLLF